MANVNFNELITFTRASGGGRFNAQGQYEWLPANEPRIDYDPVTGECRGLLIEESRTNLLLQSQNIASSSWSKTAGSVATANAGIGIDGGATATLWQRTTTGPNYFGQLISKPAAAMQYTALFFVRKGTGRYFAARVQGVYPSRADAVFDLDTGTVSRPALASSNFSGATATIAAVGVGYLVVLTATSDTASRLSVLGSFNSNNSVLDGTDSVADSSGYILASQLETGAFPTSYIPTTTAQVTRAADVARVNELSPWYNAESGTFVIKHDAPAGRPLLSSGANVIAVSQGPGKLVVAYDAQGSYVSYNDSPYVSGPALSIEAALDLFKSATSYMGARGQSVRYFPRKLEVAEAA